MRIDYLRFTIDRFGFSFALPAFPLPDPFFHPVLIDILISSFLG